VSLCFNRINRPSARVHRVVSCRPDVIFRHSVVPPLDETVSFFGSFFALRLMLRPQVVRIMEYPQLFVEARHAVENC